MLDDAAARQAAWKEALSALDLALDRVAPADSVLLLERSRFRLRLGEPQRALEDAAKAQDSADAFLARGRAEFGSGTVAPALRSFERSAESNPRLGAARYWRGVCLQMLGKADEARKELLEAISLGFDGPDVHARLASIALEQKALVDVPGRAARVLETADAVTEDELFARSRGGSSRRVEIPRLKRDAHYLTARARFEAKDYEKTLEDCDRALLQDPSFPEAHFRKGYALYWLRRHDEAIKEFGKAIELKPKDAAAYIGRATTLAQMRRFSDAVPDYDKALDLEPDNYTALGGRGLARAELGLVPEARADLKRALDLAPDGWNWRETIHKVMERLR
jgi:tetratricopeptide (TPR) repeat protein